MKILGKDVVDVASGIDDSDTNENKFNSIQ